MQIQIHAAIKGRSKEVEILERWALKIAKRVTRHRVPARNILKSAELSILLTTDKEIRKINKRWRGKDKATDVLSFPTYSKADLENLEISRIPWTLGDIVISYETCQRQANEKCHSIRTEMKFLLVHGFLHLLGFDHEISAKEANRMRRLERALLTHI